MPVDAYHTHNHNHDAIKRQSGNLTPSYLLMEEKQPMRSLTALSRWLNSSQFPLVRLLSFSFELFFFSIIYFLIYFFFFIVFFFWRLLGWHDDRFANTIDSRDRASLETCSFHWPIGRTCSVVAVPDLASIFGPTWCATRCRMRADLSYSSRSVTYHRPNGLPSSCSKPKTWSFQPVKKTSVHILMDIILIEIMFQ